MDQLLEKNSQKTQWWNWTPEDFRTGNRAFIQTAVAELRERFDRERGGFAGLTEEQESGVALFLLEYARLGPDSWARTMAEVTLHQRGGTGGALLAYANLEAYVQTGRPGCRDAACGILDGALRELRLSSGCFAQPGDAAVSTSWNARMIAAFAKAYRVLGEERYLRTAEKTWLFLKNRLAQPNGRLYRRWRDQTPMEEGRLEDYGLYCWALTELYEADFSVSCLREAEGVADRMAEIFRDRHGGFYDFEGGAGRGAAGLALSRLAELTNIERYQDMAREQLAWLAGQESLDGLALLGMTEELRSRRALVCVSAKKIPAWLALVGEEYRLTVLAKTSGNSWGLENAVPFLKEFPVPESGERLYLCQDGVCGAAVEDLFQLYQQLSPEAAAV